MKDESTLNGIGVRGDLQAYFVVILVIAAQFIFFS